MVCNKEFVTSTNPRHKARIFWTNGDAWTDDFDGNNRWLRRWQPMSRQICLPEAYKWLNWSSSTSPAEIMKLKFGECVQVILNFIQTTKQHLCFDDLVTTMIQPIQFSVFVRKKRGGGNYFFRKQRQKSDR